MKLCFFSLILFSAHIVHARVWTDIKGRTVEAEVVKVDPNRTVVLRTDKKQTFTVPFESFVETDVHHLEYLLSRRGRGKLHPVRWDELNVCFGLPIWQDDLLWDDETQQTAERMKLKKESKTDFTENHRAYPLGKINVLAEAVYSIAIYGNARYVDSLSFVFLNQGDAPQYGGPSVTEAIEASGIQVRDTLEDVLGKPERDSIGKNKMREKVWRWDWNGHAIMLTIQKSKYAALRIMPTERADRNGRIDKSTDAEIKARAASCVEKRKNGDVIIRNIPMVDQGPKGYCSPATWERYMRYLGIPADMYLLALAGKTAAGGGTYSPFMINAIKPMLSNYYRRLKEIDSSMVPDDLAEYIDQGLPILWSFFSTPAFQQTVDENTARRRGKKAKKKPKSGQKEDQLNGGHICLIVGYNKRTGEIAISDSWGSKYTARWVDYREAQRYSRNAMYVIKW